MDGSSERRFLRGVGITSLGTLVSRLLGLARDIATASLLGLGQGSAMDALVVALRIPNFSRRVLGEGALATSFLPEFTREHERNPQDAWRLLSALVGGLAVVSLGLVLLAEGICFAWWWVAGAGEAGLAGLTAALLPYLILICLAAQFAAALQGLGKFRWPALAPALLNVCWLAAAWLVAPWFAGNQTAQAFVIAIAVLVAGLLQCVVLLAPLYRAGFRFQCDLRASWPALRRTLKATTTIALGLAVTQINTLVDSFLAVALAGAPDQRFSLGWLGEFSYPLQAGAAAAIYYGERFYQLPVGLFGLAVATVLYPALARHAARGDRQRIGADLTAAIRWIGFTAIPAGVGLMLLAEPIVRVLFVRGAFTQQDGHRAAAMIACYASAVWAYCSLPILARGFYSLGDRTTPLRVGVIAVTTDVAFSLILIGPLGERGLALSTAIAAIVQVVLLGALFAKLAPLGWSELRANASRTIAATAVMAFGLHALSPYVLTGSMTRLETALATGGLIVAGAATYLLVARMLGSRELSIFIRRRAGTVSKVAHAQPGQAMISRIG